MEGQPNNPTSNTKRQKFSVDGVAGSYHQGEDRISELPDKLLLHTLSYLPTEKTITTGILSRRWKSLWKKLPNLEFDDKNHESMFSEHIISALLSYQNKNFESLTIGVSKKCDSMDVAIWLAITFAQHVSKLVLRLNNITHPVILSDDELKRRNTLTVLKLMGNIILKKGPSSVSLNCLKTLNLYNVRFHNKSSVAHLLMGCPVLENLVILLYIRSGVTKLFINSPSLLRQTLSSRCCQEENIIIETPLLTHLNIHKLEGVASCQIKNLPELIEGKFARHRYNMEENILASVTSAKFLALSAPLKYPMGKTYEDLTTLEIETMPGEWCNLLSVMLTSSPRLQILRLIGCRKKRWSRTWIEPYSRPTCLTSHLHTIEWEDFAWDGVVDLNVAIYMLKNSEQLKKATFTSAKPNSDIRSQERHHLLDQLNSVPKASATCHTEFRDSSHREQPEVGEDDPDVASFSG